jgi:TolA-binding protein
MRTFKFIGLFCLLGVIFIQCKSSVEKEKGNEKPSKESLKASIKVMDDSLATMYKAIMNNNSQQIPSLAITETINRYLAFYRAYPDDKYSPECLDKVQQLYLQKKVYEKSLEFTDTLLIKYPKYKNRANLLLNAGSTCELTNDKTKIKKYYSQLLKEFPNLDKETKEMIEFRLKHIHLSFDELIDLQTKNASKKGK